MANINIASICSPTTTDCSPSSLLQALELFFPLGPGVCCGLALPVLALPAPLSTPLYSTLDLSTQAAAFGQRETPAHSVHRACSEPQSRTVSGALRYVCPLPRRLQRASRFPVLR